MNPITQFGNAAIGWSELAIRRPAWRSRFDTTREGFFTALGIYFTLVIIAILVQGIFSGVPSIPELAFGIVINGLPLAGALLAAWGTILSLQLKVPLLAAMVPITYVMIFLLAAGIAISAISGGLAPILLGILAYLLYRGAREILGVSVVFALAYAALSIVLLVALPMSLYMLFAPAAGIAT
jgi:hypothetical protein